MDHALSNIPILQVLPSLVTGGVERGTVEMAQGVANAGGTALVASAGGRLVAAVERAGGRHIELPLAKRNPLAVWMWAESSSCTGALSGLETKSRACC